MAEIHENHFASIIDDCLCSSSQETLLAHSLFAREDYTSGCYGGVSTAAVKDSGEKLSGLDAVEEREMCDFVAVCADCELKEDLGFGGERKRGSIEVVCGGEKKLRGLKGGGDSPLVQCSEKMVVDGEDEERERRMVVDGEDEERERRMVFRSEMGVEVVSPFRCVALESGEWIEELGCEDGNGDRVGVEEEFRFRSGMEGIEVEEEERDEVEEEISSVEKVGNVSKDEVRVSGENPMEKKLGYEVGVEEIEVEGEELNGMKDGVVECDDKVCGNGNGMGVVSEDSFDGSEKPKEDENREGGLKQDIGKGKGGMSEDSVDGNEKPEDDNREEVLKQDIGKGKGNVSEDSVDGSEKPEEDENQEEGLKQNAVEGNGGTGKEIGCAGKEKGNESEKGIVSGDNVDGSEKLEDDDRFGVGLRQVIVKHGKRELPRSLLGQVWGATVEGGDGARSGVSDSRSREGGLDEASVDASGKGKSMADETLKHFFDVLRILAIETGHADDCIDVLETAKRCGMTFPRSRFRLETGDSE